MDKVEYTIMFREGFRPPEAMGQAAPERKQENTSDSRFFVKQEQEMLGKVGKQGRKFVRLALLATVLAVGAGSVKDARAQEGGSQTETENRFQNFGSEIDKITKDYAAVSTSTQDAQKAMNFVGHTRMLLEAVNFTVAETDAVKQSLTLEEMTQIIAKIKSFRKQGEQVPEGELSALVPDHLDALRGAQIKYEVLKDLKQKEQDRASGIERPVRLTASSVWADQLVKKFEQAMTRVKTKDQADKMMRTLVHRFAVEFYVPTKGKIVTTKHGGKFREYSDDDSTHIIEMAGKIAERLQQLDAKFGTTVYPAYKVQLEDIPKKAARKHGFAYQVLWRQSMAQTK